jgi:hypothetical protein
MSAILPKAPGAGAFVPMEGTPPCYLCKETQYIKADILQMGTVKAVFECLSCGVFRIAKADEQETWARLKGRIAPSAPQSCATVIDHNLVARSTNIKYQ